MKFSFEVHYVDPENPWKTKFKKINANSEEAAIKKFKAKYPELTLLFAF